MILLELSNKLVDSERSGVVISIVEAKVDVDKAVVMCILS
jgi:hypothetical protein